MAINPIERTLIHETMNEAITAMFVQFNTGDYERAAQTAAVAFMLAGGCALQDKAFMPPTPEEIMAHVRSILDRNEADYLRSEGDFGAPPVPHRTSIQITEESKAIARRLGISLEPAERAAVRAHDAFCNCARCR